MASRRDLSPMSASCDFAAASWPSDHSEPDLQYAQSDTSTDEGETAVMRLIGRAALRPPPRLRNEGFLRSTFLRAKEFGSQALHVVLDRRVQRGAAAGALSCGAWGGFWGLANGSVIGCSVGLMAAPFTLGFSVPVLTSMMAWTGLVVGSSAGVGAGLVGGGCAGYLYSVHDSAEQQRRPRPRRRQQRRLQ
mmetsp:Transcript_11381/g.21509  ORF Transcript_11381/g.21509 Transcript_11381/m.21509 type:complete len:191 (-) Transcript_11381:159-731(-)